MPRFFETLNYSSCNEDWRTERRALAIRPGDRVLAVCGSGDRPLHLLLDDPAEVVAIDANAAQLELLRTKMARMDLPYGDYVEALGLRDPRRGLIYQGRWERHYRRVARLARLARGGAIDALFACRSLDEQRRFVRERWDRRWWRQVYRLLCSAAFSQVFLRDPAFYRHVSRTMSLGDYIYDRMLASLGRNLARENFMLSLVFRGVLPSEDLPPYLSPEGVASIAPRRDRIVSVHGDLIASLESGPEGRFDRFSLSDVPSYLGPLEFERLLRAMVRSARPGARFCIRQFLTDHRVPSALDGILCREPGLEGELEADDRAFAYRFIVGTIRK